MVKDSNFLRIRNAIGNLLRAHNVRVLLPAACCCCRCTHKKSPPRPPSTVPNHFFLIFYFYFSSLEQQNQQFRRPTVPVCTVSSLMKINAMSSGIAGTAKPADTNAHRDWHTIVKHVSACGPIKYQNAETKASFDIATIVATITAINFPNFPLSQRCLLVAV